VTVGYSAFYPLPESFFEDPETAGEQPVGNGPFQADEPFQPGVGITLTRSTTTPARTRPRSARSSTASTPT
jgi:ABC-type oligopeptide transport system substrate-binding subunit